MSQQSVAVPALRGAARIEPPDCARIDAALTAFQEISDAVSDETELTSLLDLVAAHMCALLSVDRCAIYLRDEETGLYRSQLLHARRRVDPRIKRLTCGVEADAFTREVLSTRAPVVIADARTDSRPVRSAMQLLNVHAVLGVPMLLRGSVLGILYADVEGERRVFSPGDVRVAATFANLAAIAVANARTTRTLRATLDAAARQNTALRRAAIAENRLAELVLEGADLDQIAGRVAQLTAKPCAIYGADGRRIGSGAPPGDTSDPALLEPEQCAAPEVAQALAGLRSDTTSVVGPFRSVGSAHRLLVSPVAVGGEEWGRIVLMERGTRLSAFDAQVARRVATIIALEISPRRRASELHIPRPDALLRELLSGRGDDASLRSRASFHRVPVDDRQILCLVSGEQEHPAPIDAEALERLLHGRCRAMAVDVSDGVAVMLRADAGQTSASVCALVEELLASPEAPRRVIAGVSSAFSGVAGYARAYHEARQVTRCLRTFAAGRESRALAAEELGAGSLFLASTSRDEADEFVKHTLGPLLDQSERSMRDLLATLAVFFSTSRSVRETSEAVGVHENTIRYRLARIAELTGLDVATNADHQLAGQLATLVLRLEDRIPAASPLLASAA